MFGKFSFESRSHEMVPQENTAKGKRKSRRQALSSTTLKTASEKRIDISFEALRLRTGTFKLATVQRQHYFNTAFSKNTNVKLKYDFIFRPRGLQTDPRGPKRPPRGPQEDQKGPQEAPERLPRRPQDSPRGPKSVLIEWRGGTKA